MAKLSRRLAGNVPGDFYVDDSCIDCDACRQIAPAVFREHGDLSIVYRQPSDDKEVLNALSFGRVSDCFNRHNARV